MKRVYELAALEHFKHNRQMLFLTGPRQVGKTTTSENLRSHFAESYRLNWDNPAERLLILEGPARLAKEMSVAKLRTQKPLLILDELHKYEHWKDFLKGFFDSYPDIHTLVTGSASLNFLRHSGDSLMGRYFNSRIHPLSVAELTGSPLRETLTNKNPQKLPDEQWDNLMRFGGFPEPFLRSSDRFYNQWKIVREQQLFHEDLRDLTRISNYSRIQTLAELLKHQAGQLSSYTSFANKVGVSIDTIKKHIDILNNFFYCFSIKPWSQNISRSLLKEPKYYLWDWSLVPDAGQRFENFVASHLLKATHFWTDQGFGQFDLYFLRDKEQREVDFLITQNQKPWILVEAKTSENAGLSESLYYFQKLTKAEHAFQVVYHMPFIERDCFELNTPTIVPARTLLAQLI